MGRFGLNVKKKRNVSYCGEETLGRHIKSPLMEHDNELASEFDTECWEIIKKKKKEVDDIPVHISLFVYQVPLFWDFSGKKY